MSLIKSSLRILVVLSVVCLCAGAAFAQTTAFNFQGRLNDGTSPANGSYDLQFKLFDAITGGNQVGATITKAGVTLVNGLFSTPLDFGAGAFTGGDRFIEIGLRRSPAGAEVPNAFVILGPRQQLLAAPYAVRSLNATLADDSTHAVQADNATHAQSADSATSATNATNATNAQTAVNAQQLGGVAAGQYVQQGGVGTVKAMATISYFGDVLVCYNSTLTGSAATTPPCGIAASRFTTGGYGLTFNFPVSTRPTFVTVYTDIGQQDNVGAYLRSPGSNDTNNRVDVRTYKVSDSTATSSDFTHFTIVVF